MKGEKPIPNGPMLEITQNCIELTSYDRQTDPETDDRVTLGVGSCEVDDDENVLYKSTRHFNKEVGKENIELTEATKLLSQLDDTQLKSKQNHRQ